VRLARRWRLTGRTRAALGLGALILASGILRTGGLSSGYWTDEGITVGIASHPLSEIPRLLGEDGSPPLYYVLLHGWMGLFGASEPATRSLSLVFALAAIPLAFWAGAELFGRRAAWVAAAGIALVPFLTRYAQESRMYSLVVDLSLVATAAFVLGVVRQRRRHLMTLTVALALLLYTHNWSLFLIAALAVCWFVLWVRHGVPGRDGVLVGGAVTVLYAPWIPTVLFQASHTGAPWASRPTFSTLMLAPAAIFGSTKLALPLLAVACAATLRRRGAPGHTIFIILGISALTAAMAWTSSQIEPAWATRYLAIVVAPIILAVAGAAAAGGRLTAIALGVVALFWCAYSPSAIKSNIRTLVRSIGPDLVRGDIVLSSAPEDVPVLRFYLPTGLRYLTPSGVPADPWVTDWRDLLLRMRTAPTGRMVDQAITTLAPGQHLVLVRPNVDVGSWRSPFDRMIRARGSRIAAQAADDPRLLLVEADSPATGRRSRVGAEVYLRLGSDRALSP
jgi:mannosyltransferase